MVRRKHKHIIVSGKLLGSLILLGLIIQFILPNIGIRIGWVSTLIYVVVGFYLFLN